MFLTLPCAIRSIDVVEAANSALNLEVFVVVFAQLLRGQLLQTIGILGLQVEDRGHVSELRNLSALHSGRASRCWQASSPFSYSIFIFFVLQTIKNATFVYLDFVK